MSENTEKKEITYIEPIVEYDAEKSVVTNIGFTAGSEVRYGIVFQIPTTDEEAKSRYDCDLNELVKLGVKQITTRPSYKSVGFDEAGNLVDGGHEAMQTLADEYRVGKKATGGAGRMTIKKAKAEADAAKKVAADLAAQVGMSVDDVTAMIAKAKAAKAETE